MDDSIFFVLSIIPETGAAGDTTLILFKIYTYSVQNITN